MIGVSRGRIIVFRLTQGNHQLIGPADSFSDSLLVLVANDVARDDVQAFAVRLTAVPVRTVALETLTPDGSLAAILGAEPGEAWVIRPDCYIAAVVLAADRATLAGAICRVLAWPAPVSVP